MVSDAHDPAYNGGGVAIGDGGCLCQFCGTYFTFYQSNIYEFILYDSIGK